MIVSIVALFFAAPVVAHESRALQELRDGFPAINVDASASLAPASEHLRGVPISGFVDRTATTVRVFYPRTYDDPVIATAGSQRVVLRATGARRSAALIADGKIIYENSHDSVNAIEVPTRGRSEELLLLRERGAPLEFEYEIVEMEGVTAVAVEHGAIRFLPAAGSTTLQIDAPWIIDAAGRRSDSHARWTLLGDRPMPRAIRLTVSDQGLTYPIVVDPSFSTTGSMITARQFHSSTLLPNGKVLIAGGIAGATYLASAELYDPVAGTFATSAGTMTGARAYHTATLLPDGKVLIAGGATSATTYSQSAELYDPVAGTFTATDDLATSRRGHTATRLRDGRVLIAGGYNGAHLLSAELYDPASGTFTATGDLGTARQLHTAALLSNGYVLIAGGESTGNVRIAAAELYDPSTGMFAPTGNLLNARASHTATALTNGKVLVAGGLTAASGYHTSAETFDPATSLFTATTGALAAGRTDHAATLLPDGRVLISGGRSSVALSSTEIYNASTNTFSPGLNMNAARSGHTATMLRSGQILMAGTIAQSELHDPTTNAFTNSGNMTSARYQHTSTLLPNGKVLVAGGFSSTSVNSILNTANLFEPSTATFTPTGFMTRRAPDIRPHCCRTARCSSSAAPP